MHSHHHESYLLDLVWLSLFLVLIFTYLFVASSFKRWPVYRSVFGVIGILSIAVSVIGPLASIAHTNFTYHMLTHLLLGMWAPLMLVLSTPMTFLFRVLPVKGARRLSGFLKTQPIRFITDPFVASILNIGGLWLLYTTNLYEKMHESMLMYVFIHIHVSLAGLLFTMSLVSMDPNHHQTKFLYRAVIFVVALASHSILAKYIYAHPPIGVPLAEAEAGGMLMYYGGAFIDSILIFIFCYQWFYATRPRVGQIEKREII
ncbi:cytochrome c oxidase assembly protein [Bacillus sp. AK128]